ncbi:hypothetical protein SAMN05421548_11071 [Paraburkholderia lycopersici]|uniref:Uncharacterized protein n=1 Tax=Paraburkholderia lycopersici TaxID=416944 RepID=A0A1G6PB94_9BURK|nr:hypothetical protein SAMN05421548_11071 [Paraburkholderia lycopersici]
MSRVGDAACRFCNAQEVTELGEASALACLGSIFSFLVIRPVLSNNVERVLTDDSVEKLAFWHGCFWRLEFATLWCGSCDRVFGRRSAAPTSLKRSFSPRSDSSAPTASPLAADSALLRPTEIRRAHRWVRAIAIEQVSRFASSARTAFPRSSVVGASADLRLQVKLDWDWLSRTQRDTCEPHGSDHRLCASQSLLLHARRARFASALTTLASTANPSPSTSPSLMRRRKMDSKTCRKASLSRKHPCRFLENVE